MSDRPLDVDVSGLPSLEFGPKSLLWWGTLGFIVIEGFTILLAVATYFYLRLNQYTWPPEPTPLPDLLLPTVNMLLLLGVMYPMRQAEHHAKRFDRDAVTNWLLITTIITVPTVVLRWYELDALNVRWDSNAYASAAWAIVILHGTLIAIDLLETGALTFLFYIGHAQKKHYSDAADAALYQYYLSISWVPLYLIVYWSPRFL